MDFHTNPRLSFIFSDSDSKLAEIIRVLKQPPYKRSQLELKLLYSHTESLSLFNQLTSEQDEQMFKECCQVLRHQYLPQSQTVFHKGDKGEFFYLILEGQVSIFTVNEDQALELVCSLGPGGSFGELALLRDEPRIATIVCSKDCHFATLCKADYLRVLGQMSSKRLEELFTFFSSLPTFSGWSKKSLIKLSYYFKLVKFKRNQVIFQENDSADSVFIVKKGEVELSKQINLEHPPSRKIGKDGRLVPVIKKKNLLMKVGVRIEGVGEIIGDDDVIRDVGRSYSCMCYSSTAELLEISKADFKKRIRAEESLSHLSLRLKVKETQINNSLNLYKQIKKPTPLKETTDEKGKKILYMIKEKNPWNSAQKEIKAKNILKKAIGKLSGIKSLPLSPKTVIGSPKATSTAFLTPKSIVSNSALVSSPKSFFI